MGDVRQGFLRGLRLELALLPPTNAPHHHHHHHHQPGCLGQTWRWGYGSYITSLHIVLYSSIIKCPKFWEPAQSLTLFSPPPTKAKPLSEGATLDRGWGGGGKILFRFVVSLCLDALPYSLFFLSGLLVFKTFCPTNKAKKTSPPLPLLFAFFSLSLLSLYSNQISLSFIFPLPSSAINVFFGKVAL